MLDYKKMLNVLFVAFAATGLHLIVAQAPDAASCRVQMICGGSREQQTQWREIEMNGIKGDRGSPGKMGPRGPPGRATVMTNDTAIYQLTERLNDLERRLTGKIDAKLVEVERRISEITGVPWASDSYRASNGFSYRLTTTSQTFQESRKVCLQMGGHLAYKGVRNPIVHRELIQHFGWAWLSAFIDLTDIAVEGQFRWRDGMPVSRGWTNWEHNHPIRSGESKDCVMIHVDGTGRRGVWSNYFCNGNHQAFCEKRTMS